MPSLPRYFGPGGELASLPADGAWSHALLETMRCHEGRIALWPLHRARLLRCGRMQPGDLLAIEHTLEEASASLPSARVRLRLGELGGRHSWDISLLPLEPLGPLGPLKKMPGLESGIRLFPCSTRMPAGETANPGCKFLQRTRYNRANSELPGEFPACDGLMLDSEGRVIESLRCNLLLWCDSRWVTPDLSRCGVRGVMRDWLGSHIPLEEVDLTLEEMCQAEEVALCNSLRGVIPVRELIGHRCWHPGAQTRRLQQLIAEELW